MRPRAGSQPATTTATRCPSRQRLPVASPVRLSVSSSYENHSSPSARTGSRPSAHVSSRRTKRPKRSQPATMPEKLSPTRFS